MPEHTDRLSPYLVIGVDYGAPLDQVRRAFARQVRKLRRAEAAPFSLEDLNWALHEIETADASLQSSVEYFRVPANRATLGVPTEGEIFLPAPVPLPRRTEPPSDEELAHLAVRALRNAVSQVIGGASAARRGNPYASR